METIKSVTTVLLNGKEWVVRARLSSGSERFKGVGAGYTKAQAQACASAPGAPRAAQPASELDNDREPDMANFGSTTGMPSCWVSLPDTASVTA